MADKSLLHIVLYAKGWYDEASKNLSNVEALKVIVGERCGLGADAVRIDDIYSLCIKCLSQAKNFDWERMYYEHIERFHFTTCFWENKGYNDNSDEARLNFILSKIRHLDREQTEDFLCQDDIEDAKVDKHGMKSKLMLRENILSITQSPPWEK